MYHICVERNIDDDEMDDEREVGRRTHQLLTERVNELSRSIKEAKSLIQARGCYIDHIERLLCIEREKEAAHERKSAEEIGDGWIEEDAMIEEDAYVGEAVAPALEAEKVSQEAILSKEKADLEQAEEERVAALERMFDEFDFKSDIAKSLSDDTVVGILGALPRCYGEQCENTRWKELRQP